MPDQLRDQLQTALGAGYTLARELGGGGMSRVFVAREEALGRDVVIKVLAPELAEGLSAERFAREIRLAAGLQEPHIVPVHAAGVTAQRLPFYTMPYVRGESLRARLVQGPMILADGVAVLRDVARALAYAHRHGIVHRDIKPENVLLHEGTAVVTDFGIAKALAASKTRAPDGPASATLTQNGTSLGTPAYMAPEQAASDPTMDHRADIYAWGVVAYEVLAGQHPFAGKTSPRALLAAHFGETPAPLALPVPTSIAVLVARCLAKDPDDRPANAGDLVLALDSVHLSAPVQDATGIVQASRRMVLVAGIVVTATVLGAMAVWQARARAGAAAIGAPPMVAVLPFETVAGTAGVSLDSTFGDGLGDAITGKLARLSGLRVIDRASVRLVARAAARPQAAGRTLGADFVLRATLRWARGADGQPRVQVSPVLVRVADGTTHWAGEPTVIMPADVFTVQGVLAAEIAEALGVALAPAEKTVLAAAAARDTAALTAVWRGSRILRADSLAFLERYRRALAEAEYAYKREPAGSEGWSLASYVLTVVGQATGNAALLDSAAALARQALSRDPGEVTAVNTLFTYETARGRPAAARALVERAVQAHPSSAPLRVLLALVQHQSGDTTPAWPNAREALRLAPQSSFVLTNSVMMALALRRYAAAEALIRWERALEPTSALTERDAAQLAAAIGDSAGVARSLRAYVSRGGAFRADEQSSNRERTPLQLMRVADRALGNELLAGSPSSFRAQTAADTLLLYREQVQLLMQRVDSARARALLAKGLKIATRLYAAATPQGRVDEGFAFAWFAAASGDREAADRALNTSAASASAQLVTGVGGQQDAAVTCGRAEAAGLTGDVATMLAPLRRCLTMANGYPVAMLGTEFAFTRHAADPRMQALAAELRAVEQRARGTPAVK